MVTMERELTFYHSLCHFLLDLTNTIKCQGDKLQLNLTQSPIPFVSNPHTTAPHTASILQSTKGGVY